jgi:hypothetical protein
LYVRHDSDELTVIHLRWCERLAQP